MNIAKVKNMSPMAQFLYWIKERHRIYVLKESRKPKPWTDDEVLQSYFFTNPYRENDKVTKWFRENVRNPLRDEPEVFFATVCFRWFNWIPTGELLMGSGKGRQSNLLRDWKLGEAIMRLARAEGQVFTGAFNISNSGSTKPKINRVCEDYIQPVWEARKQCVEFITLDGTMEGAHRALREEFLGLGGSGFMAYEIVCDLRYTKLLRDAPDKLTWSNPGPGAKRGLNRLLGRDIDNPVRQAEWADESCRLLAIVQKSLKDMPRFEMREIEHSLCEYDKYVRALNQDGHLKRRYDGHAES